METERTEKAGEENRRAAAVSSGGTDRCLQHSGRSMSLLHSEELLWGSQGEEKMHSGGFLAQYFPSEKYT